jgi:hypothetical protein
MKLEHEWIPCKIESGCPRHKDFSLDGGGQVSLPESMTECILCKHFKRIDIPKERAKFRFRGRY